LAVIERVSVPPMTTVLLSGAGGSAAANFLDALRRSGAEYRVVGVDSSPVRLHLSEADECFVIPRADDPSYEHALVTLVGRCGVDMVHPQPDPDVLAMGRIRDALPAATYLPLQSVLRTAADKVEFAAAMARASVPVPESLPFDSFDSVADGVSELLGGHERVWIRARVGAGARASLPVRSPEQALAWIRWWIDEQGMAVGDFMAAEFLPGREFAYQSVWRNGELVAGQARERVEYLYGHLTPHGQTSTPAVARTVREPEVDAVAMAAIRALDPEPRGAYCVDLKEAADGRPRVTEINAGRFFTTSNFFAAAGLNMPDLLVRCALGEHPAPRGSSPLEPDLYWIRMVDMRSALVTGEQLDGWRRADS
jgi:carbamoyl-phosphate synthase large subunit